MFLLKISTPTYTILVYTYVYYKTVYTTTFINLQKTLKNVDFVNNILKFIILFLGANLVNYITYCILSIYIFFNKYNLILNTLKL